VVIDSLILAWRFFWIYFKLVGAKIFLMKKISLKGTRSYAIAAEMLADGKLVMHPTETCYGLAVDIFDEEALKKLYKAKGRSFKKPVSILVSSLAMAEEYGVFSDKALDYASRYWPGPLSIVVPRGEKLPRHLNPAEDFISIRFSDNKFCTRVVDKLGHPITTTSANRSGDDPLYDSDVIGMEDFAEYIDLVVDGGELPENKPSTILKVVGGEVEVLRHGDVLID